MLTHHGRKRRALGAFRPWVPPRPTPSGLPAPPSLPNVTRVQLFAAPRTAAPQASLSFAITRSLLKLVSIESVMPSNHLILCGLLPLLPSIFPSIRSLPVSQFFESGGQSTGSFSFSISPSNENSGLISFRMDWSDLLAIQGTLKSLLQHHSSKVSSLRHSAVFIVQL